MKYFVLFVLFAGRICQAQTFEHTFDEYGFQLPTDFVEVNGGYIMTMIEGPSSDNLRTKMVKIGYNGQIIQTMLLPRRTAYAQGNMVKINENKVIHCHIAFTDTTSQIVYRTITNELLVIDSIQINTPIPSGVGFTSSKIQMFADSTLMHIVSFFEIGNINNANGIYAVTINTNFSTQNLTFHPSAYSTPIPSMVEKVLAYQNSDTALIFLPKRIYRFDKLGIKIDSFPEEFYNYNYDNLYLRLYRPIGATWVNNKLVLGGGYGHTFAKYRDNFIIDTLYMLSGLDSDDRAAYYEPLSGYGNNLFIGGTNDQISPTFIYGTESALRLYKMDLDLNQQWHRDYNVNDGFYYYGFNIFATSDGGCIIAGTKNNNIIHGDKIFGYVLKVDSLGNPPIANIENPTFTLPTLVYPNPGTTTLTIETPERTAGSTFRMYNSTGMLMLQKQMQTETETIDVSNLPSGIYIYETQNHHGTVERGKWVKMN